MTQIIKPGMPNTNRIWNYLLMTCFILVSCFSNAQETTTYNKDSSVVITKDTRLDELIAKQKDQNLQKQSMSGFRIQIYFGSIRQKAIDMQKDFSSKYPGFTSYLSYQQPNFKVRIGDYRSRFEAQKFLKETQTFFPTSFIVPDEVKLPPIK
jgi:hypothetical protein